MQYTLVGTGPDDQFITVFIPGDAAPLVAHSSHPNFEQIVTLVLSDEGSADEVRDLFDTSLAVARKFERLSERVTVNYGRVYFDGDEVNNALTRQILRFIDEDIEDVSPLVNFFEKVQQNPQPESREQLYEWLDRHNFTITPAGDILAYKGVQCDSYGVYLSINSGYAIVDGQEVNGRVSNHIGAIVEMPRQQVAFDPAVGCSTGLHVGTYSYASGFGRGATLEVHVNPRDVVSVPTDCDAQKVRVCRYRVVDVNTEGERQSALTESVPALEQTAILSLLTDARENAEEVVIDYSDANGDQSTRLIEVVGIEPGAGQFGTTIIRAIDVDEDDYRAFRLDRISRAVEAA